MDGYANTILYVDLTKGSVTKKPYPAELKKNYLGGRGLGVKLVSDLMQPETDALDEKSVMVVATGPLTGIGVPLGARHQVVAKSPLNNTLCSSDSGAFFGHEMKVAGFDAIVITGKATWTKAFQDLTAAIDAIGMCIFTSLAPMGADDYAAIVTAATGIEMDGNGIMEVGDRIWNVQKLFNMKQGYTKKDDTLPTRLLTEPLKEGAPAGRVWEREPLLDEYYAERGWDSEGVPTAAKLAKFGLAK